jgi:hypothetical protein
VKWGSINSYETLPFDTKNVNDFVDISSTLTDLWGEEILRLLGPYVPFLPTPGGRPCLRVN